MLVVSHARRPRWFRHVRITIVISPPSASPGNAVFGIEALLESFAVLVRGMLAEHLAAGGALEGLEARLALDGEGGGILQDLGLSFRKGK